MSKILLISKTETEYKNALAAEVNKLDKGYLEGESLKMGLGQGAMMTRGIIIGKAGLNTLRFLVVLCASVAVNGWKMTSSGAVTTADFLSSWTGLGLKKGRQGAGVTVLSALAAFPEVAVAVSWKVKDHLDYTIGEFKKVPGDLDFFLVNGGFNAICGDVGLGDRKKIIAVYMKYIEVYIEVRSKVSTRTKPAPEIIAERNKKLILALSRPQPFNAELTAMFKGMFEAYGKLCLSNDVQTASAKAIDAMSVQELKMFGYSK